MPSTEEISKITAETLVKASTSFAPDQVCIYEEALRNEQNPQAKWVLEQILAGARVAEQKKLPLCDDTGIPHVFLEVGEKVALPPGFLKAVSEGLAAGLRMLPGRPMAVKGCDEERITQEAGLFDDPAALQPAPFQIRATEEDVIRLTILMLGGGPEIRGKTLRIFHKHSLDIVVDEMVAWATEGVSQLGCLPAVLFFGVGRTNLEAASLALEAMKDACFTRQSLLEERITKEVNKSGIGPLGLGGKSTVLATFLKIGPQRASGVRIVSLRVGCCFDPRRASYEWSKGYV